MPDGPAGALAARLALLCGLQLAAVEEVEVGSEKCEV